MLEFRCLRHFLFLLAAVAATPVAADETGTGTIYSTDSDKKLLVFTFQGNIKESGDHETFTSRYLDSDGKEALTEEAKFDHLALREYVIHQEQLGETYELKVDGDRLLFEVKRQGQIEKKERARPDQLFVGPSLVPFLSQHWAELEQGKKVKAWLAVLDRMNIYAFEFTKVRDIKIHGRPATLIRMAPTGFLVSAVVQPTYLSVSPKTKHLLQARGRMLPKLQHGNRWKDFDGEADFE